MKQQNSVSSHKKLTRDEYISKRLLDWKRTAATQKGFDSFPVANIRINPNLVDRDFFEKEKAEWIKIYYQNHYPLFDDLDTVYICVNRWLEPITPSMIKKMNPIQAFEVLCCRVWTLLIAEKYGQL